VTRRLRSASSSAGSSIPLGDEFGAGLPGEVRQGGHQRPTRRIPPGLGRRTLRITVTSGGKSKVNIAIPLGIARMGKTKIAASGLVREQLAKFGIDLDDVLRDITHSGPIVDISDGDDRVMIVVE